MAEQLPESRNILLFGASGRSGVQIIRAKQEHPNASSINLHAFVRDPKKLEEADRDSCASIQVGDATVVEDIKRAIDESACDTIIVAIGHTNLGKQYNTIREKSALAMMEAIGDRTNEISLLLLSAVGAGGSTIRMGFGLGALIHFHLRHPMADQTKQEGIIKKAYADDKDKLLILRPPELVENKPKGKVTTMEHDHLPNFRIDRKDLAEYMINQAFIQSQFGKELCITTGTD